ncbi:MAG: cell division protein FtsQ [Prevotella sp.]|nr:cell division protein FtsQ [Prevotella sp.]
MKLNVNWKRTFLVCADIAIGGYLFMALTAWHRPVQESSVCTKVVINIADDNINGFLNSDEVKTLLTRKGLYPLNHPTATVNPRKIEQQLVTMPFVKTAQCYLTTDGHAFVTITQNLPIIRVKSDQGEDYYVDANGGVMPNSQYTSDMIIVTGHVSKTYANRFLAPLAQVIMDNDLWRNQIEQINVLPDLSIELVPRVGDHIVCIGQLPSAASEHARNEKIKDFVNNQLTRLEQFYRFGLAHAGWNKYDYISLEYANQVVCRKRG